MTLADILWIAKLAAVRICGIVGFALGCAATYALLSPWFAPDNPLPAMVGVVVGIVSAIAVVVGIGSAHSDWEKRSK